MSGAGAGRTGAEEDEGEAEEAYDALAEVELGLPGEPEPSLFTSAAGGRPLWLQPLLPPEAAHVACGACSEPLALLVQLYAPLEAAEAFHRYLYLFACRRADCHFSARLAFKLLRAQLPRHNPHWPADDPGGPVPPADAAPVCLVCGLRSSARCGGCKQAAYCGALHQKLHWNAGHRAHCNAVRSGAPRAMLPPDAAVEWGFARLPIRTEPEPEQELSDEEGDQEGEEEGEGREAASGEAEGEGGAEGDHYEDATYGRVERDAAFAAFSKRVAREPSQVLRYTRWDDAAVLWVARDDPANPAPASVAPCPRCGAARRAEFQVLPQLLHFLRVDPRSALDWGTLVAYTCSASCAPPTDAPYTTELVVRQNFTHKQPPPPATPPAAAAAPASAP